MPRKILFTGNQDLYIKYFQNTNQREIYHEVYWSLSFRAPSKAPENLYLFFGIILLDKSPHYIMFRSHPSDSSLCLFRDEWMKTLEKNLREKSLEKVWIQKGKYTKPEWLVEISIYPLWPWRRETTHSEWELDRKVPSKSESLKVYLQWANPKQTNHQTLKTHYKNVYWW